MKKSTGWRILDIIRRDFLPFLALLIAHAAGATDSKLSELQQRAEAGDAEAQFQVGRVCAKGEGVPKDEGKAFAYFRKAAEAGHSEAEAATGFMFGEGRGVPRDPVEAVRWFKSAAKKGVVRAQFNLGWMLARGTGVDQNLAEAITWYEKAGASGMLQAQMQLAQIYYFGENGIPQDLSVAEKWVRLAAEQGNPWAENTLGAMYENGKAIPADTKLAAAWYLKAAEKGFPLGQSNLGRCYCEGKGVERSAVDAYCWLKLSSAAGDVMAAKLFDGFSSLLTPEEVTVGEERAKAEQVKIEAWRRGNVQMR